MGFREAWMSFIGAEENESRNNTNESTNKAEIEEVEFVNDEELGSFETSIFGQLELMKAELSIIQNIIPTQSEQLINKINAFQQKVDDPTIKSDDIESEFKNIQSDFDVLKIYADGVAKIKELQKQNNNMKKRFKKPIAFYSSELEEAIKEYKEYIKIIQKSVDDEEKAGKHVFTKMQREVFNIESLKAEYRIGMLSILNQLANDRNGDKKIKSNPFKNLPKTKQKMFGSFILEDANELGDDFRFLTHSSEIINRYYDMYSINGLDEIATELDKNIADITVKGDFSFEEIFDSSASDFDSEEFLRKMVLLRYHTNQITNKLKDYKEIDIQRIKDEEERIAKEKEEEERRKQEEEARKDEEEKAAKDAEERKAQEEEARKARIEQLKNMTDKEIEAEILKIERDMTANGSRYVNILDFQKEVAVAKGLLPKDVLTSNPNLAFRNYSSVMAYATIQKANRTGVNYLVFPDSQEIGDGEFGFVSSKDDEDSIEIQIKKITHNRRYYEHKKIKELGSIPYYMFESFSKRLIEEQKEFIKVEYDEKTGFVKVYIISYEDCYDDVIEPDVFIQTSIMKIFENVLKDLKEIGNTSSDLKDVLSYVSIPTVRNMIPILEALKEAGVEYYLEPIPPNRNTKERDNIHIYYYREYEKIVDEKVMPKISSSNGIVKKAWEEGKSSFGEAIYNECKNEEKTIEL